MILLVVLSSISWLFADAIIPVRNITAKHFTDPRDAASMRVLLPRNAGVNLHFERLVLTRGNIEDPGDLLIDTLPVFQRMDALKRLQSTDKRTKLYAAFWDSRTDSPQIKSYKRFLLSTLFMEAGVIQSFLRIVSRRPGSGEESIQSIDELLSLLKNEFKNKHSYSIDFLTTRMLMEWTDLLYSPRNVRIEAEVKFLADSKSNPAIEIPQTALLNIAPCLWKSNLDSRFKKLSLTGYENIDL